MSHHAPSLHVGGSGEIAAVGSGAYGWRVHRRGLPVAFLTTSLLGLGDGDRLSVGVDVAPGTAAVVTAQGPTSLLSTRRAVHQEWRFRVRAGAHLAYLPWHAMPFPGSRSVLRHRVELAPGATAIAWDVVAIGRVALGERWAFDELRSEWDLVAGGPLLRDRLRLRAVPRRLGEAAFGGWTHLGSLLVGGLDDDRLPISAVRELVAGLPMAGVTRPAPGVLLVRALDRSAERLEAAFWPVVALAQAAAGAPAFTPEEIARRWFEAQPNLKGQSL